MKKNYNCLYLIILCFVLVLASCTQPTSGASEPNIACMEITREEYDDIAYAEDSVTPDSDVTEAVSYWKIVFDGMIDGCPIQFGVVCPSATTKLQDLMKEGISYFVQAEASRGLYRYQYGNLSGYSDIIPDHELFPDSQKEPEIMIAVWLSVDKTDRFTGRTERFTLNHAHFWYPLADE